MLPLFLTLFTLLCSRFDEATLFSAGVAAFGSGGSIQTPDFIAYLVNLGRKFGEMANSSKNALEVAINLLNWCSQKGFMLSPKLVQQFAWFGF